MESLSQYLASPTLLLMTEASLLAFKVLFVLIFQYYCLYPKVSKRKKNRKIVRGSRGGLNYCKSGGKMFFLINNIEFSSKCLLAKT